MRHTAIPLKPAMLAALLLGGLLLASFMLGGCGAGLDDTTGGGFRRPEGSGGARLSIFLQLRQPESPDISMTMNSIEVLGEAVWTPLTSGPVQVAARQLGSGQQLLARQAIPAGRYQRLRFTVAGPTLGRGERTVSLELHTPSIEVALPAELVLYEGESLCLFVTWDVVASQAGVTMLAPVFDVRPQVSPLLADLAFVACPEIDTIYAIRTDKNWVTGALGVRGRPTYLAVNPAGDRLYVLAAQSAEIKVVEIATNQIVETVGIPVSGEPEFMALSEDGRFAYVLEERGNALLRLELATGSLASRTILGVRPSYARHLTGAGLLAVSAERANMVLLLHPETLAVMSTITAAGSPQGVVALEGLLYVTESTSNTVTVYDLASRSVRSRINVGFAPMRIIVSGRRLYVANNGEDTVSVLLPGQLRVFNDIRVGRGPLELAVSEKRRWLYVSEQEGGAIRVVDLTGNRVAGSINLAATPLGLAVVQ